MGKNNKHISDKAKLAKREKDAAAHMQRQDRGPRPPMEWKIAAVQIADCANKRGVFPAVAVQYAQAGRNMIFSYSIGFVDMRDDIDGTTFRPSPHVRDLDVVTMIGLLQKAAAELAVTARNMDKQDSGHLSASIGALAAKRP